MDILKEDLFKDAKALKELRGRRLAAAPGGARAGPVPLGVGAQDRDSQDKVEHDGGEDHSQPQEDGPVFTRLQSSHRFLLIQ